MKPPCVSKIALLLCMVVSVHFVNCSFNKLQYVKTEPNDSKLLEKWRKMETKLRDGVQSMVKQVLPMIIRSNSELNLTPECAGGILKMVRGMQNLELWAFMMIDAFGKPMDGIMTGSISAFGAFDQCLDTKTPDGKFQGQYCTVEFRFPLPEKPKHFYRMLERVKPLDEFRSNILLMNETSKNAAYFYSMAFRFGVCAPSVCTIDDISQIATQIGDMAEFNTHVKGCEIKEEGLNMDATQISIFCVFLAFGIMVVVATIVDYLPDIMNHPSRKPTTSFGGKLLQSFSIKENARKLLQTENIGENSLPSLHGYRFLAMTWVILGHAYLYIDWQLWEHFAKAEAVVTSIPFQVVTNASPCVDSFFFLGGFLVCYTTLTHVDKKGRKVFNIPIVIFRRIWRLLPASMMIVGMAILMPLIGSGPLWKENINLEAQNCRANWWVVTLFGNNIIFPTDGMCLPHLWYVSADMHLFLCSMVYLFLLLISPKLGTIFNIIFILAGVIASGAVTYINKLPPVPLSVNPDYFQRIQMAYLTYFATYSHTPSYGIGLSLGHILARHREKIKFTRVVLFFGWIAAFLCNCTIIYVADIWLHDRPPRLSESVAYASLYRVGWSLGLAWMVTCCATGYGGIINTILSWKAFVPLSRLTFITYLVHLLVIEAFYSCQRGGFETGNLMVVWFFFGFFMVSFGLAVICRMLFEAPILEVEKVVLAKIFFKKDTSIEEPITKRSNGHEPKMEMVENGDSKMRKSNGFNSTNGRHQHHQRLSTEVVLSRFNTMRTME